MKELHEERQGRLERAQKERHQLELCFELAGLTPAVFTPIPNGYCSQPCCAHLPWFRVETMKGVITIGWRKRVINIDWSETGNTIEPEKWQEDVTKDKTSIHAWGYGKAIQYLEVLRMVFPHSEYRKKEAAA